MKKQTDTIAAANTHPNIAQVRDVECKYSTSASSSIISITCNNSSTISNNNSTNNSTNKSTNDSITSTSTSSITSSSSSIRCVTLSICGQRICEHVNAAPSTTTSTSTGTSTSTIVLVQLLLLHSRQGHSSIECIATTIAIVRGERDLRMCAWGGGRTVIDY